MRMKREAKGGHHELPWAPFTHPFVQQKREGRVHLALF